MKMQLDTAKHDTTKIKIYLKLVEAITNDEEWPAYNDKALELIEKNADKATTEKEKRFYLSARGDVFNNIGYLKNLNGDTEGALEAFNEFRIISEKIGEKQSIAYAYNNLGVIYNHKGDIKIALSYYMKSMKIYEELKDKKGLAFSMNNIGYINQQLGDIPKAIEYTEKGLKLRKEIKDKQGTAVSLNNLANLYTDNNEFEKASELIFQSIEIRKEIDDIDGLGHSYNNLGMVFSKLNDLPEALKWFKMALEMFNKIDNRFGKTGALNNIGDNLMRSNKMQEAEKYHLEALKISKELGYPEMISSSSRYLFPIYQNKKDYKKALEIYMLHVSMKDSVANIENRKLSLKQQFQYEYEKKEAELKLIQENTNLKHNQEVLRQRIILIATLFVLLVIVVFSVFLWNRFKVINRQKNIIELQKLVSDNQKAVVEQKNREITQSIQYAQKIQSAILPSEDIFKTIMPDSFILFKPKDIVSGDFYWLSDREDYVFYATADSTGHGVPGGFMSMLGISLLNEIVDERKIEDCGQVLTLMRDKIILALKQAGDSDSKDGMDMVLIRIDKKTLKMEYAAANNSMYIVSNRQSAIGNENCMLQTDDCQLLELPCDKMPVGVYHSEIKPFQTFKYQLQKGDIIYTYTDGYADQFGGDKGKKYTYKRLREKLVAISQEPLVKQKISLESEFESWKGDIEQVDDVCLIGVKV
jgi:tetratricopeptide (TPR) repeat protein